MALVYSRSFLKAISSSVSAIQTRCSSDVWCRLTELGISRVKPTRRGCRGGRRKFRILPQQQTLQYVSPGDNLIFLDNPLQEEPSVTEVQVDYHNELREALNIQIDTFENGTQNHRTIPRDPARIESNNNNQPTRNVPKIMLANVMFLTPKITEVAEFAVRKDIDLVCITETWLKERIADSVVEIPNYSIMRLDRQVVEHGGVCVYVKDGYSKYRVIQELQCCEEHEISWVHLRPPRLPRGYSCLVIAIVYHPDTSVSNNDNIRDHLFSSLTLAESMYPNCAFIVCGDFNRLNVQPIMNLFRLKQIVKVPTRKNAILDLIVTNLQGHYENPQVFPPFGLSDHNTVLGSPKAREKSRKTTKFVLRRDLRLSRKAELGRYLGTMDWRVLFTGLQSCEELLGVFQKVLYTGLELLMPVKRERILIRRWC